MKRCSRCQTEKPFDSFAKDRKAKDGHSSRCKQCMREATRERDQRQAIGPIEAEPTIEAPTLSHNQAINRMTRNPDRVCDACFFADRPQEAIEC